MQQVLIKKHTTPPHPTNPLIHALRSVFSHTHAHQNANLLPNKKKIGAELHLKNFFFLNLYQWAKAITLALG